MKIKVKLFIVLVFNLYHLSMVYSYLFWIEGGGFIRRISLATHAMLTLEMNIIRPYVIKLDCVNEKVYGFVRQSGVEYISVSDYDGGNQRNIVSGPFSKYILGVFGDLLYFIHQSYIKEMNLSNRTVSRTIAVEGDSYYDLIVVHTSLQQIGEL